MTDNTFERSGPQPSLLQGLDRQHQIRGVLFDNLVSDGGKPATAEHAGIIVGLMSVPIIVTIAEDAIRAVPDTYIEAAEALADDRDHRRLLPPLGIGLVQACGLQDQVAVAVGDDLVTRRLAVEQMLLDHTADARKTARRVLGRVREAMALRPLSA